MGWLVGKKRVVFAANTLVLVATSSLLFARCCDAFVAPSGRASRSFATLQQGRTTTIRRKGVQLGMALDLVTYLRTEWISAALCTNQTPKSARTVLQLGTEDGRAVTFLPRTISELITSTADDLDGTISLRAQRQLKQQAERRNAGIGIKVLDQRADALTRMSDESVDVVISLQAADRMRESGMDWTRSIREAARVLKPGGRFLFVERTTLPLHNTTTPDDNALLSYVDHVMGLTHHPAALDGTTGQDSEGASNDRSVSIFEMVGYDDVDLVIVPHVAGVVIKSVDANGRTIEEREALAAAEAETSRLADLSIRVFERGIKKRRRKKTKKEETTTASPTEKK